MPFIADEGLPAPGAAPVALPQGYAATPEAPTDAETRPSIGETFGSAFSLENEVVGAIKSMDRESNFGDWDEAHNPWDTIRGTDLEPYHGAFVGSRNQKETDHMSGLIRKEMEHRKVLERSNPALAFGAMGVASILSPTTLIPGGTIYRGLKAGRAAAKSAAAVGAANAAAAGIQEGILHSQQYTRTLEESGLAIGGSFLLAGILGGAVGGLSSAKFAKLTRTLENDLNIAPRFEEAMAARMAGEGMEAASVGAATTAKPAADLSSAFGLEKTIVKVDPVGRTMNAASPAAREIETMLAELPMQLTRNAEGFTTAPRGGSVETRIKTQGVALEGQALHGLHRHWAEYRFGNPDEKLTGFKSLMKRDPAKLSEKDFNVEVGKAMARGDEHTIPEVAAAAKHIRKTLIDPLADSAVKYKLLSADVVKRGRPKGAQTQGSQVPTPPPAAPVMAGNIDALLRQIEDVSGQKIDPAMRNGIVDTVAANEDLVRQLRELASGEADIPFAMRDAAPIGRTIDDVVDDLEDGYPVMVERAVVDRVMEAVTDYRVGLPDAARSVPMHVMVGVVPAGDGMVSASFRGLDGGFRSVDLRLDDFRRARAFSLDGGVFLPAVGFSGKLLHRLRGEIGHELVHALRLSEGIEAVVFARLVAHAESLKVLDMSLGDMMRVLGESSVTTKPLREVYQTAYAYAKGDDVLMRELLGQEAIAHMVELRHHGALSDEQLAPVLDDMDRLFGRPVENGHQAVVRRWVDDVRDMVDVRQDGSIAPMLAVRDDGDALRKLAEHIDGIIGRNGEGTSGGGRDAGVGADTAGAGDGVVGHRFKVDPVLRARAIEALIPERYGSDVVAARAKIQGWNVTGYHGTNTAAFDVPDAFVAGRDFGFHVAIDAPKAANSRLGYPQTLGEKLNDSLERLLSAAPSRPRPKDGGAVIPLKLRVSNPLELPDIALARKAIVGNWTDPVAWQSILKKSHAPQELVAFVDEWIVTHRVANNRAIINKHNFSRAIAKKLSDLGFDAVTYKNAVESAGSRSMFVWDASRIRSAFDMFDDRAIDDVGLHASARYVMADVKERLNAFMRERGISEQPLFAMSDAETGRSMRLRDYLQSMFRSIVYHGEASAVGTPPDVGMSAAASGRMAQGSVDDLVFRLSPTNDRAVMDDYERAAARQTQSEMKPELSTVDGGKSVVAMTALFLERGFKRSDGSSITVENAYKHYADWASKNGLSQLTLDKFREAMHHVGFVSQRIAARDRYVGVDVADNSKNILLFAMRDLAQRINAPLIDDMAKSDPHPGRVMAIHGTKAPVDFAKFDPEKSADFGVHFGTKDQAEIPSGMTTTRENARMIPVVLDLKTVVDVPDLMTWPVTEVAEAIEKSYPLAGGMTDRVRAVINAGTRDVGPTGSTRPSREALAAGKAELRRLMSEAKIDGLRYWNESEGDGWSYIVWDEGKVTSAITGQPMLAARGDDVLKKIRSLGGIKDATGDLKAMGAGERSGIINNDRGLSPDAMREHLVQAGYLQDVKYEDVTQSSVNDLYDLVSEALSSEKGPGRAYRDEMAFHALQSARKMFEDTIGIELKLTPEQERQIVGYILDQRMSVSDALERFGMAGPEPAAKAGASSDPVRPARAARFLDEMRERAEEAGFGGNGRDGFSDDVADEVWKDGGQTYITRLYNRVKIASQRPQFKALISDYFEQSQQRANAVLIRKQRELADAEASGAKIKADDLKDIDDLRAFTGLSRQELEDSANTVIDHILGHPEGRLLFDLPAAVRGPLKARTLRIPDSFESAAGKFEDFLDRDISTIARFYTRTMVPDIEATRMFGSLDMKEQLARIGDDYKKMSESPELDKMPPQKAEQTRRQLQRERERVERDLLAQMDRLRGTYALPDDPMAWGPRAVRAVKTWNMTRMLGGMTISAVPDIFRPMMVHGVMSYFGDGIRPLFGGLKAMKLAGDEVRLAGTAWDMVLSSRAHAIADVLDDYGRYSKFERGLGWVQDKFGVLSLMNQWNTAVKQWSGMITMNNVLKASQSVASGSASKADIRKLASSGIDSFDARIIAEQFAKHGVVEDGVYLANSLKWDVSNPNVRNALESFRGAVVRDVDRIIVTPGQDKPLWMSTQLGSMVGQFKSFGVASMQRTLVAGLQQRDAGVVMGALLMIGMGGVVEYFKSLTNDKPLPKTEAQWVAAAVDRAGLIGWLSDANNFVEKFSGGTLGVGALTGKELSRFASRNLVDAVMGPTAGTITDLGVASSGFARAAAGKDDLREADIAALRRLIPMQNLFYLSYIFQKLEQAVSDGVGARPGSRGSRLRDRISMNEGWLDEFAGAA